MNTQLEYEFDMSVIDLWNQKILNEINNIKVERPELLKYIEELSVTIPDESKPEITAAKLKEYYNSLLTLSCRYEQVVT